MWERKGEFSSLLGRNDGWRWVAAIEGCGNELKRGQVAYISQAYGKRRRTQAKLRGFPNTVVDR